MREAGLRFPAGAGIGSSVDRGRWSETRDLMERVNHLEPWRQEGKGCQPWVISQIIENYCRGIDVFREKC